MKKTIIASLIAIVLLSACKETETTTVDITGTANITGTVLADIERVNTPFVSEPVDSVLVTITWDSGDLAIVSDGDERTTSLSVRTNSNGEYSVEVPTTEEGVEFTIEFDELITDITYNNGLTNVTESVVFDSPATAPTVTVRTGETVVIDQDYEDDFKGDVVLDEFATIFGTVVADIEQITTKDIPEIAEGATVTVEWTVDGNTKSLSTTTDAAGAYSIQVPVDESTDFDVIFEEFTATVSYNNGLQDVTDFSGVFSEGNEDADDLEAGEEREVNFSYADDFVEALPLYATIEGYVELEVDGLTNDRERQTGIILRVTWVDADGITRGETVTTGTNGEYTINVPVEIDVPAGSSENIMVTFPRTTIENYDFNNGTDDVVGTAIYNERTADRDPNSGDTVTVDFDLNPDDQVEN